MRRVLLSLFAVLLLTIVAGCGEGGSSSKSTASSLVSITIGGNGQTGSIKTEKNTLIARAGLLIRRALTTAAALAAIPPDVTHIVFTISAPDITTITRDVLISGQASVTETFTVPNGKNRRFMVEAKDSSGKVLFRKEATSNMDGMPVTITLNMEDVAPPVFAGLLDATPVSSSQINLSWNPAADNLTASSSIAYNVYASKTSGGQNFTSPSLVTSPGTTSFPATGLESDTTYYFIVRADDRNGNVDTNLIEKSATTLDTTPPSFSGLAKATHFCSDTESIKLTWSSASDNVTSPENIIYLIYVSATKGGQNFAVSSFTTSPGSTSFSINIPAKLPNGTYYFVVRAKDDAGNIDTNTAELSVNANGC